MNSEYIDLDNLGIEVKRGPIYADYSLTRTVLGTGRNGEVKLIVNKLTNQKFAHKIFPLKKQLVDNLRSRLEIQLQVQASQDCDFILKIINVYMYKNALDVVLEYATGGELFKRIEKRRKERAQFTEDEIKHMFSQIARGVKHMHDFKIAHRDLKPENILLDSTDPANFKIKICDFGFAKDFREGLTSPCCSESYVAPEILRNMIIKTGEKYDASCDIWSLGVLLYLLTAFEFPFRSNRGLTSPNMQNNILNAKFKFPDCLGFTNRSSELKDLIRNMIVSVPEQRYTIDQVVASEWLNKNNCLMLHEPDVVSEEIVENDLREDNYEFSNLLSEIRINNHDPILKSIQNSTNPLYEKRLTKNRSLFQN